MMCMSGLSGCDRARDSLPPEVAMDSSSFSSFGTVMGQGRGLSSCSTMSPLLLLLLPAPPSGRLSKFRLFTLAEF